MNTDCAKQLNPPSCEYECNPLVRLLVSNYQTMVEELAVKLDPLEKSWQDKLAS